MSNLIVDTSVIIKWLNSENEDLLAQANNILLDAQTGKVILFAPQLSRYEIGNALFKKKLDLALAQDALGTAYRLPVNFVPETPQLAFETYQAAQNGSMTYYDASFIALAKQEKAALITDNVKHQGKTKKIKVIALKDYK